MILRQYNEGCGPCKGVRSSVDPRPAPNPEKGGASSGCPRLFLVARRRPILRALSPIGGAACQPLEGWVIGHSFEHPAKVVTIVGGKTEFGIVGHDFSQSVECLVRHDSALMVAAFWPRIGKQDKHAVDRSHWQRCNQQPRVVGKDADVFEMSMRDSRQQFGYSVLEDFAADEAGLGMMFSLQREMLAPTKPDLEPSRLSQAAKQHSGIE
jgi:hypothetical protein